MHLPKGVQKPSPTQIVLTACLLLPSGAFGQSFLFGARFGIDHSRRPLIGASGERKLWRNFAIGADFLYRRATQAFRYTHWGNTATPAVSQRQADFLFGIVF